MRPESTLPTPRIDSIAAAGMRFTDAHSAAAVCSPSRYAILTGRYGWRSYLSSDVLGDHARPLIDSDVPTLGSMLQQHGYRTAAIGKWHLGLRFPRLPPDEENSINRGFDWNGEIEGAPVGFGFDEFFGVSGNLSFHPRAYIRNDRVTAYPDQPYTPTGLFLDRFRHVAPDFDPLDVLDRFTEEAVAFIDRSAGQENPFFLYFALTAPHTPLIPESRFVGTTGLGYYGDFVAQVDWIVGQVLDALGRAGIADDTLLVFTSDNGSRMYNRPSSLAEHHVTNPWVNWYWPTVHKPNDDWRGMKSTIYEGGHRVPYLVQWPGVVPAGSETAFTFAHVDLYATLADILGHRLEDEEALDSLSILPVLRGEQATSRRSVVNHSAKGMFAVRSGPWKLVLGNGAGGWDSPYFNGKPFARPYRLYNLSSNPAETESLIEDHRERADELEERLSTIRSSTKRSQLYSDDASLEALALSGIEMGEFAGEVWGYSAQVANDVMSTTVTATAADEYATVVISDGKNSTVGTEATVELGEGGNTILITVTAEDMYTTGTYAVVVARENAATVDPGLPSASPEITSGSSFTAVEGETAVARLTATDTDTPDSDLIWSLSGGADQGKFIITNSGVLAFGVAKDYEAPDDTNTDGVYQVTVQVSDGGRTDTADLTVTLANLNEAPTANAGEDQRGIGEGAMVTLSGSGSDPDPNDALTYAWTQTGGPSVQFIDSALAAPTFVAPAGLSSEATLTFTLRVTDAAGLYHEDETTVGVVSSAPLTAVFEGVPAFHDGRRGFEVWLRFNREVGLNSAAFTNGLLTVDGGWVRRASRLNSGSTALWKFTVMPWGDRDIVITLPAGRTCGTTGAVCTLDDRPLAAAASARVAGPVAPVVTGSTRLAVLEGETAVATLTASDADTPATDLQWSIPSGSGGGADRGKFTITAGGALAFVTAKDFEDPDDADTDGSYQVRVRVSDSRWSDTEDLTVTLSDRNEAPTAEAGADRQDIEQGATVILAGSGSDPDADDTLTYAWTQTGGADVTLSDATAPAPSFTAPTGLAEDATLTFSLKVTDQAGLYHEDAVSVSVKARPPPVATIAAAAGTVTEGAAAQFTVSLDAPAATALPVAVSVSETGAALSGSSPATVDFAAGESSKTLSLATADDQVVEPDSTVTATLSLGAGYTVGEASSALVSVEDDDTATFTVSAAPEAIAEGESATLTVAISNGVTFAEDQTISLAVSGTASASDYTGVPATLTLAAGASSVTAGLAASEDQDEEEAETVAITASHGSSSIGSATVTINSISHDATLGALSLSGIEIGAFSGAVTAYQASVEHAVATTTVTATATHSAATVSIEPGSEVSLAVGANEIAVTVTAEDGTTTQSYTVTVTRAEAPALPMVSVAAVEERLTGPIGEFRVSRTGPTAEPLEVQVLFATSRTSRERTLKVRFPAGRSSVTRRVQAGDNKLVEDDITVTWRLQEGEGYTVSAEHASASVVLEESDIPEFAVSVQPAEIAEGESATVTVAITNGVRFRQAQTIALAVSGTASASDYTGVPATLTLAARESSVTATLAASADQEEEEAETVTVTASHDGSALGSAILTIHSVSHDATLGTLSLSGIEIGAFSGAVTTYEASVEHAVATTTVTATATHSAATVSIEPGSEVSLAVGANEIAVTVTAEDGTTTQSYTVTVTRAEAPALPVVSVAAVEERVTGPIGEFTVSRTGPTAEPLELQVLFATSRSPRVQTLTVRFLPGQSRVTRQVQAGDNRLVEDDITVTWTLQEGEGYTVSAEHGSAAVVVEESDVPEFSVSAEPAGIAEGESAVVTVAITNGVRFREAQTIALAVSGTASATDYTGVPETLTLRAYGTSATFSTTATLTAAVDEEQEEAETVTVTASRGGSAIGSATVTITSVSHDATLGALSLSGIEIGAFSGAVTSYRASVDHAVEATTVTATASHPKAAVSIEPGSEVSLAVGANEIAVTVIAEDGTTTQSYTVTVTRAEPPALPVVSIAAVEERVTGPIGEFTVSRTGPTAEPLELQVLVATSRTQRVRTLTVRFPAGQSSVTRRVQAGDNKLVEDDITLTWTLEEGEGYTVSAEHGSAAVVLEESDVPEFAVSAEPAGIAEGESATVTVAITNGVRFPEAQTIALAVSGTATATDYTGVPETLALPAYRTKATTATLTATVDPEQEADETVTITASHGGAAIGSATVTIGAGEAPPLTAQFAGLPARHDGETAFAFELRFSEEIRISYKTLRDGAFEVTGGAVIGARRLVRASNLRWEITAAPASDADVVLALPPTADCAAAGAVCTAGGKALAGRLEATVKGPGSEASGEGFSLDSENTSPSGIWSDGETAWVADLADTRLYAYSREDGERQPEKDIATEPSPMGLWSDGETLWVARLGGGLRAHRLADGSRQPWRDLSLEANAAPGGVWSDGETAWVSEWLGDTVHAYRLSDGRREAGRDIELADGNLMPAGLWSDGETLWVADWRERVFAYRLSDGGREPSRDVAAGAADTDPTGLWSGGGTLLSTSWDGSAVRAYRLPASPVVADGPGKRQEGFLRARAASLPPITDPALASAIVVALGKASGESPSPAELAGLETLQARNGGIRDLTGLEGATGLKELDLGFNSVADLRPLAALPALESLNLDGTAPDLPLLASLKGLKRLSLRNTGIDDLQPLASLAGLTELDVGDNRIADLSPLAGLTQLTVLRADRNRIGDLWPLASLAGLEVLELGSNRVRDLQPLAGLTRLRALRLEGNGLTALHPLAGLDGLSDLGLAGNAVGSVGALADLGGLRRLDLRGTAVEDLRPLRALPSLVWLHVGGSRIQDLAPLDNLPGLTVAGREDRDSPDVAGKDDARASRR